MIKLADLEMPSAYWDKPIKEPKEKYIQGKRATSYEWNVATALDELKIKFWFQVGFFGGRKLKGGLIVDFIIDTVPLPTPVWVHGEYWHKGQQRTIDQMQRVTLFAYMGGSLQKGVVIWGDEVKTVEDAKVAIKKKVII